MQLREDIKAEIKKDILDKKLKKIQRSLPPTFVESMESAQNEELKMSIAAFAIELEQLQNQKDVDEDMLKAKETLEVLSEAYKETNAVLRAKIKWCVHLLESRGAE